MSGGPHRTNSCTHNSSNQGNPSNDRACSAVKVADENSARTSSQSRNRRTSKANGVPLLPGPVGPGSELRDSHHEIPALPPCAAPILGILDTCQGLVQSLVKLLSS